MLHLCWHPALYPLDVLNAEGCAVQKGDNKPMRQHLHGCDQLCEEDDAHPDHQGILHSPQHLQAATPGSALMTSPPLCAARLYLTERDDMEMGSMGQHEHWAS